MKKIGIATITSTKEKNVNFNYGNVLQNYALTKYIKKNFEYDVETIYYSSVVPEYTKIINANQKKKKSLNQFISDCFRVARRKLNKNRLQKLISNRNSKFNKFLNEKIKYGINMYRPGDDFTQIANDYEYVITGSDQVWNPYYEGSNSFFYLGFMPRDKRISYAPSIGVSNIPTEIETQYGEWVKQINFLSIREQKGKEILKEKYDVDAELVCDPVFLLDKSEWLEITNVADEKEEYFAVYLLGRKTPQTKKYIKKLEKIYKIKAVDIYTGDDVNSKFAGPEEFVSIIANSKFVVTDSFHGFAFSIIFKRPVVLVDRNSSNKNSTYKMNSRIENLLNLIKASNREIEYILNNPGTFDMKYDKCQELENLIKTSKEYLSKCIK